MEHSGLGGQKEGKSSLVLVPRPDLFLIGKANYDFHKSESKLKQFGQKVYMCLFRHSY